MEQLGASFLGVKRRGDCFDSGWSHFYGSRDRSWNEEVWGREVGPAVRFLEAEVGHDEKLAAANGDEGRKAMDDFESRNPWTSDMAALRPS